VTDNGGPFRSFRFAAHPELRRVRTRVNTPGQNGVRERAFESLKYERLYREDILDVLDLTSHAEEFRIEFNTIRPHEALSLYRPREVHLGLANPTIPTFERAEILPLLDAGQAGPKRSRSTVMLSHHNPVLRTPTRFQRPLCHTPKHHHRCDQLHRRSHGR
jgi:hypothetical protein